MWEEMKKKKMCKVHRCASTARGSRAKQLDVRPLESGCLGLTLVPPSTGCTALNRGLHFSILTLSFAK